MKKIEMERWWGGVKRGRQRGRKGDGEGWIEEEGRRVKEKRRRVERKNRMKERREKRKEEEGRGWKMEGKNRERKRGAEEK